VRAAALLPFPDYDELHVMRDEVSRMLAIAIRHSPRRRARGRWYLVRDGAVRSRQAEHPANDDRSTPAESQVEGASRSANEPTDELEACSHRTWSVTVGLTTEL